MAKITNRQVEAAIHALFTSGHRRLLARVLEGETDAPETTTVREVLPVALESMRQKVNSAESNDAIKSVSNDPALNPLIQAESRRIFRIASRVLAESLEAEQTVESAIKSGLNGHRTIHPLVQPVQGRLHCAFGPDSGSA